MKFTGSQISCYSVIPKSRPNGNCFKCKFLCLLPDIVTQPHHSEPGTSILKSHTDPGGLEGTALRNVNQSQGGGLPSSSSALHAGFPIIPAMELGGWGSSQKSQILPSLITSRHGILLIFMILINSTFPTPHLLKSNSECGILIMNWWP
jgi:hypothetical protein